jgi:hypothetical protein
MTKDPSIDTSAIPNSDSVSSLKTFSAMVVMFPSSRWH